MSQNLKHYQALNELVVHTLLALYSEISQQGGFWSVKRRNERLVKSIKPKLKLAQFSMCKKDMKTMLSIGRSPVGNLERRLWEINNLNLEYQAKFSQADELYIMLLDIDEHHQFYSQLEKTENTYEVDTLYMKRSEIEEGFDEFNQQIKPLAMTVKTSRLAALVEAIQSNGIYHLDVAHVDEFDVTHVRLHRSSCPKPT